MRERRTGSAGHRKKHLHFGEITPAEWHDRMLIEEREDTVRAMTLRHHTAPEIAMRLRISTRSIERIQARLRNRGDLPQKKASTTP